MNRLFLFLLVCLTACQNQDSSDSDTIPTPDESLEQATIAPVGKEDTIQFNKGIKNQYEGPERFIWQKPEMIIDLIGDLEDKVIADIGAGTGYFALPMTSKAKKVIAIDIDPRFINYLDSVKVLELPENLQERLETRLAEPNDPNLKKGEADVVIIVNTFMYIQNKVAYLRNLKQGIAENGRLLIIDFKRKRTSIGPPSKIRTPLFEVEEALYKAGYSSINTNDTALNYQYIVLAEK
ncbi:MAG: methyltransferase [Bacteroidota bacterium]